MPSAAAGAVALAPNPRPAASDVRPTRPRGRRPLSRAPRPGTLTTAAAITNGSLEVRAGETPMPSSIAARSQLLGCYVALETAQPREILTVTRPDASILVVDCFAGSLGDARLVARIAPEESPENARIVCELYLADETRGRARLLAAEDLDPQGVAAVAPPAVASPDPLPVIACDARRYRIRTITADARAPELRWTCSSAGAADGVFDTLTLRDVIARLQDYEPTRTITVHALAAHAGLRGVSTCVLRCELERLVCSRIVLNRGLREGVDRALAVGATMSEIAIRCGRVKRDRRGNVSGETSWLGRRIGRLPEARRVQPTPWVHSRTLALIARDGLGVSPNEVEL
jgi:hypothetical protein